MFDDGLVRLAVRAYVLSIPLLLKEDDLIPLMSANKAYFLEGGKAIQYMQAAGAALAQGALAYNGPSVQQLFGVMPPGLAHLPGQVDARMRSNGVAIGQEFLWLSQVLPPAAMGDYGPYKTTGTSLRQQEIAQAQMSKYPPAEPGALESEPLKAAAGR
jgi:hypothetical protein